MDYWLIDQLKTLAGSFRGCNYSSGFKFKADICDWAAKGLEAAYKEILRLEMELEKYESEGARPRESGDLRRNGDIDTDRVARLHVDNGL